MAEISIENFPAYIKHVNDRLEHASCHDALAECRPEVLASIQSNFEHSSSPEGVPWTPRKDSKPHPLLRLSLLMMNAATGKGSGHVDKIDDRSLAVGVSKEVVPYSAAQNFGFKKIPPRKYLGAGVATLQRCASIIGQKMLPRIFG